MKDTKENEIQSTALFSDLEETSRKLKIRKQHLTTALSVVDRKKTDIEHYVEFYNLSASKGYKASKMLKDCLCERRAIKNELEQIDDVLRMNIGFIGKGKLQGALTRAEDKRYTPRVLKELFSS